MDDSEKLDFLINEIVGVKGDINEMKGDIQCLKTDMQEMKTDMQEMKTGMQEMKTDMQETRTDITKVQLHLENVTDKNIRIIAEGHVDLNRKLNDALRIKEDDELLRIRVNILEEEVQKLNQIVDHIA